MKDLVSEFHQRSGLGVPVHLPFGLTPEIRGELQWKVSFLLVVCHFISSFFHIEVEEPMDLLLQHLVVNRQVLEVGNLPFTICHL